MQVHSSIPLNNVVLAVLALLGTILVQWKLANFKIYDMDTRDGIAAHVQQEHIQDYVPYPPAKDEDGNNNLSQGPDDSQLNGPDEDDIAENGNMARFSNGMQFTTSNFLTTAKAVRQYGSQYTKFLSSSKGGNNGLRNRKTGGTSSVLSISKDYRMPNYTAMMKTGSPIVIYNYINHLKVTIILINLTSSRPGYQLRNFTQY
jgi:hypothetical protein